MNWPVIAFNQPTYLVKGRALLLLLYIFTAYEKPQANLFVRLTRNSQSDFPAESDRFRLENVCRKRKQMSLTFRSEFVLFVAESLYCVLPGSEEKRAVEREDAHENNASLRVSSFESGTGTRRVLVYVKRYCSNRKLEHFSWR